MTTMHSQQRNTRIQLQRRQGGGSLGHPSNDWEDIGSPLWANIRYGTGSETIRAGQIASQAQVSIRIGWRTDITAAMRVLHKGTAYDIQAVLPDLQQRRHVDLVCKMAT